MASFRGAILMYTYIVYTHVAKVHGVLYTCAKRMSDRIVSLKKDMPGAAVPLYTVCCSISASGNPAWSASDAGRNAYPNHSILGIWTETPFASVEGMPKQEALGKLDPAPPRAPEKNTTPLSGVSPSVATYQISHTDKPMALMCPL